MLYNERYYLIIYVTINKHLCSSRNCLDESSRQVLKAKNYKLLECMTDSTKYNT